VKWIFCASCGELDSQEEGGGGAFFDLLSNGQYSVIALITVYRGGGGGPTKFWGRFFRPVWVWAR